MNHLSGKTILIASGPTFAPLDAVRSITNHSSGWLGSEIGYQLHKSGADIIFMAGDTSVTPKDLYADNTLESMNLHRFRTVPELKELLKTHLTSHKIDVIIMAAAVLDYLPAETVMNKQPSNQDEWVITLKRGEKLIERIHEWSSSTAIVGFKLESGITQPALQDKAVDLMNRSGAVFVIGNLIETVEAEKHHAVLFQRNKISEEITVSEQLTTKREIALALTAQLIQYFHSSKETI